MRKRTNGYRTGRQCDKIGAGYFSELYGDRRCQVQEHVTVYTWHLNGSICQVETFTSRALISIYSHLTFAEGEEVTMSLLGVILDIYYIHEQLDIKDVITYRR